MADAPDDLTWIRTARIGQPDVLTAFLDPLRAARDFLQVIDPLAQGVATVAEFEARLLEILQAASVPRTLGRLLADQIIEAVQPYMTDGVYYLQYSNLGNYIDRVGLTPALRGAENYINQSDIERLSARAQETSAFIQFGPEAEGEDSFFESYRSYPQVIDGQLDIRARQLVKSALDVFDETEFNAFTDWLSPIIAAFYDTGDPLRPVMYPEDRAGGFLLAVQGTDPATVLDLYAKIRRFFDSFAKVQEDFDTFWDDIGPALGYEALADWELTESLQLMGVQLFLRPHLVPRYSARPDFLRLSTADFMPFFANLLVDASNLVDYTGQPFPENFALTRAAQKLADFVRKFLEGFDIVIESLTLLSDLLQTAGVWRLVLPTASGGVDGLTQRIAEAKIDLDVRITRGTVARVLTEDGFYGLVEGEFGRIITLPDTPGDAPSYNGEAVGSYQLNSTLLRLEAEYNFFLVEGFNYTDPRVYRAGELMRESEAKKLKEAYIQLDWDPPGNLLVAGFGAFYVEGALSRFFEALFTPDGDDWEEYLNDGPPALVTLDDLFPTSNIGRVKPPFTPGGGTGDRGRRVRLPEPEAGADAETGFGQVADGLVNAQQQPDPGRILQRLERYGSARSAEPDQNAVMAVGPQSARGVFVLGDKFLGLGLSSIAAGDAGATWLASASRLAEVDYDFEAYTLPPLEQRRIYPFSLLQPPSWALGVEDLDGESKYASLTVTDAIIGAGGTLIQSSQLGAALANRNFGTRGPADRFFVDLELTYADGSTRYVRTWPQETDGLDTYVEPALPCVPVLETNTPAAAWFSDMDMPTFRSLAGTEHPSEALETAPAVCFEVGVALQKVETSRAVAATHWSRCGLQVSAGGHIIDVDNAAHGSQDSFELTTDSTFIGLESVDGTDARDVSHYTAREGWPSGRLHVSSAFVPTDTLEASPAEVVNDLLITLAQGNVELRGSSTTPAGATYTAHRSDFPAGSFWRLLSASCPRLARLPLSTIGDLSVIAEDALVWARPSTWQGLLVEDSGTWTWWSIATGVLGGAQDDATGDVGYISQILYGIDYSVALKAAHPTGSVYLAVDVDPYLTGAGYAEQRPTMDLVPAFVLSADDRDALEPTDVIQLSHGPWARWSTSGRSVTSFAGSDPFSVPEAYHVALPKTSSISAAASLDQTGGGLALVWANLEESWKWGLGMWTLWQGRSHRVRLIADETSLTFRLEEWALAERAWTLRLSLVTPHVDAEQYVALITTVIPSSGDVDMLLSTSDDALTWTEVGSQSDTVDTSASFVRPLEGMSEAGGSWRIGSFARPSSFHDAWPFPFGEVLVVEGVGTVVVRPSTPPMGFVSLVYQAVDIDGQAVMLDLYR